MIPMFSSSFLMPIRICHPELKHFSPSYLHIVIDVFEKCGIMMSWIQHMILKKLIGLVVWPCGSRDISKGLLRKLLPLHLKIRPHVIWDTKSKCSNYYGVIMKERKTSWGNLFLSTNRTGQYIPAHVQNSEETSQPSHSAYLWVLIYGHQGRFILLSLYSLL